MVDGQRLAAYPGGPYGTDDGKEGGGDEGVAWHGSVFVVCRLQLSQCMGELVGAAGGLHAAADAFGAVDNVLVLHAFDE